MFEMCGIVAIVAPEARRCMGALRAMMQNLAHRGPDGQGEYAYASCLLGHRRLNIVDLHTGNQPMLSADKKVAVTYNGEIYNFRAAKKQLHYPYSTNSDTEVLLAAYSNYGNDMCRHLHGMFAFALWDNTRQCLFCGRDRFGEKPLYYAFADDGSFLVASEIRALLASGMLRPRLNKKALAAFLQLYYIPEEITIFENIHQLAPGHSMVLRDGSLKIEPYWQPPPTAANPPTEREAAEELDCLLRKAVRQCMNADVEVGLLLSGGLDSTTIAALASEISPLRAFGFGMSGDRNELPYARLAARHYGLQLVENDGQQTDFAALLQELPQIYDEPLADSSCLPTLLLCRNVRHYVKAALAGDGGDELLGGYTWYADLPQRAEKIKEIPPGWTRFATAHAQRRRVCTDEDIILAGLEPFQYRLPPNLDGTPGDALRMDTASFLPSDILRKTDRAAMSCGLELRSPFLDVDVANFLLTLPWTMKLDGGNGKKLLSLAFAHLWPSDIAKRKKQGFGMSVLEILHRPDLTDLTYAYLFDRNLVLHSLFPEEWLQRHTRHFSNLTWCLLILSLWCEHAKNLEGCHAK